jgi:hypothetical protein
MELTGVNEHGMGNIRIFSVDDYYITITNNKDRYKPTNQLQEWSFLVGQQIETVTDIINNIYIIRQYVKDCVNVHDYRNDNDPEYPSWEYYKAAFERMYADPLFYDKLIRVGDREYLLYKFP